MVNNNTLHLVAKTSVFNNHCFGTCDSSAKVFQVDQAARCCAAYRRATYACSPEEAIVVLVAIIRAMQRQRSGTRRHMLARLVDVIEPVARMSADQIRVFVGPVDLLDPAAYVRRSHLTYHI
jgi:hypothetical protein